MVVMVSDLEFSMLQGPMQIKWPLLYDKHGLLLHVEVSMIVEVLCEYVRSACA